MIHTRRPELPEDFDPYAAQPEPEPDTIVETTKVADVSAASAWGLFGLSFAQINEALQTIALLLTIAATGITLLIHFRRWRAKK